MLQAQGDQRQRPANQQEAEAAERSGKLPVVKIIKHDQRDNQRHDQADAHQVVAHGFADATARPAEMRDKQAVRTCKGGANHHHPQQRYRGSDAFADRHRQREGPCRLQTVAQRHPQYGEGRGHQNRPEHRAQREPEMILRDFADAGAGAFEETGKVAARADAEAHQDQRAKQRQQRLLAG